MKVTKLKKIDPVWHTKIGHKVGEKLYDPITVVVAAKQPSHKVDHSIQRGYRAQDSMMC